MKLSAFTTLFAAPLVFAGALQANVLRRGLEPVPRHIDVAKRNAYTSSGTVVVEEVIVIWVNNGGGASTTSLAAQAAVVDSTSTGAAPIAVATHQVTVGGSAGLIYTPDTIEAQIGDMVVFTFLSQNHTATQSSFALPCVKLAGGMDSGFMPNPDSTVVPPPQMAMQVTVDTPIWFYCKQKKPASHCGKGMTFSINPTAAKTQAMFEQMAIAQNGTGSVDAIVGTTTAAYGAATGVATAIGSIATGTGSTGADGSCSCSCLCGVSSFPDPVQGMLNYGGLPGSISAS